MGNYLNTETAADTYSREFYSPYFVDKSLLLEQLMARVETSTNYICITRPRRFGKSVMANMIAAFFSGAGHVQDVFEKLKIAASDKYQDYAGKYDVVFVSLNELPRKCTSYEQYIERIENRLLKDLIDAYPKAEIQKEDAVWDAFSAVYHAYDSKRFIFVLDEWDFIFHRDFVTLRDRKEYIDFLSNLLKGKAYPELFTE
ncbi:MAG: AAA family ATPase [Eubacterium sp.]|nr:AAA family ATPase [Eubacterium sp.]